MNSGSATRGCTKNAPAFFSGAALRNGAKPERTNFRGNPDSIGRNGAPSSTNGGATIVKRRCWTMWTLSNHDANASSGEHTATKTAESPPRKHASRQPGNRSGSVRESFRHPRK